MSSLDFLTPSQLATQLEIKPQTVMRLARGGMIPPPRMLSSKIARFRASDFTDEALTKWRLEHPLQTSKPRPGRPPRRRPEAEAAAPEAPAGPPQEGEQQ